MFWTYQLEMYNEIDKVWEKHIRIYRGEKSIDDFDLFYIEGKRRNTHLIQIFFK